MAPAGPGAAVQAKSTPDAAPDRPAGTGRCKACRRGLPRTEHRAGSLPVSSSCSFSLSYFLPGMTGTLAKRRRLCQTEEFGADSRKFALDRTSRITQPALAFPEATEVYGASKNTPCGGRLLWSLGAVETSPAVSADRPANSVHSTEWACRGKNRAQQARVRYKRRSLAT